MLKSWVILNTESEVEWVVGQVRRPFMPANSNWRSKWTAKVSDELCSQKRRVTYSSG